MAGQGGQLWTVAKVRRVAELGGADEVSSTSPFSMMLTSARRAALSRILRHFDGIDRSASSMLACSLGDGAQSTATPSVDGGTSNVRFNIHASVSPFVRAILHHVKA